VSVINQMLKGLDKQHQQQTTVVSNGAVIVAAPKRHHKLTITLFASMVIVAVLAGYLLVQKQRHAESVNGPENVSSSPVSGDEVISSEPSIISEALTSPLLLQPKRVAPERAQPVVSQQVVVKLATHQVEPVVARIAKTIPATDNPSAVTTPKQLTPQVVSVLPVADPVTSEEETVVIKTVTRTPKQQAQLYAKQAEAALLAGDKERAKTLFSKVLSFDKHHDLSREQLAAVLYGEQRTQSAVNLLQEGLSVSPEYSNFRLMLARIYLKNNNKQQAYYYLKSHQPQVEGNVDYYAILAGLAQNLDDLDTALVAYEKLTVYEPNRAKWWLGLGITADKAKQVGLALNAYHTAQNMGQLSASSRHYINARITQLEKQ